MEIILTFIAAVIAGVIAGMLPGVTVFITLIMMYPVLIILDPSNILMMYVVIVSLSQYFGSVSATLFSIPGSTTSVPSLYEGHTLFRQGEGDRAIMFSAVGSFVGSIASLLISLLLLSGLFFFYGFFDTRLKAILLILAVIIFSVTGKNSWYVNVLMVIAGYILGSIGYDVGTDSSFMTFGNMYLYSGLPTISVLLGLYVIPFIISSILDTKQKIVFNKLSVSGYIKTAKELFAYKYVLLRSSLIGYFSGFVPGVTFNLGTTLSYFLEKRIKEKKNTYKAGDLDCLLAAETANNAGVFSQILPLLLIGIPITASQSFLYDILLSKGLLVTPEFFQLALIKVVIAYAISAFIGLFIAGKYVNWLSWINNFDFRIIYLCILILLGFITYITGLVIFQQWYYVITTLVLIPVGLLLNNYDKFPLIFAFILQDHIYANFLTLSGLLL
jgi:putative tricarboxylic transport membrane protein